MLEMFLYLISALVLCLWWDKRSSDKWWKKRFSVYNKYYDSRKEMSRPCSQCGKTEFVDPKRVEPRLCHDCEFELTSWADFDKEISKWRSGKRRW